MTDILAPTKARMMADASSARSEVRGQSEMSFWAKSVHCTSVLSCISSFCAVSILCLYDLHASNPCATSRPVFPHMDSVCALTENLVGNVDKSQTPSAYCKLGELHLSLRPKCFPVPHWNLGQQRGKLEKNGDRFCCVSIKSVDHQQEEEFAIRMSL